MARLYFIKTSNSAVSGKKMFFEYYVPETTIYFTKPQPTNTQFPILWEDYPGKTNSPSDPNNCHLSPSSKGTYDE